MMKTLLSLLLALHSSAAYLLCDQCHERSTSCDKKGSVGCNDTEICYSGAQHNNIVSKYKVSTSRGCTDLGSCHSGDYSFSAAQGKFLQLKLSCCQTNVCNTEPVQLPPHEVLSPNGLQCPACFKLQSSGAIRKNKHCPSEGNVSCLANETKCIHYYSVVSYLLRTVDILKFKGCATEDLCALNGKNLKSGELEFFKIDAKCSDAAISSKQIDLEG